MKFKSEVQLEALNNATTDTDKFLVSDSSTVKYRTGAQVLSDIGAGTVTSVAALTLGTAGTDLNSTVANGTGAAVITLNVPDASATARGVITTGTQTFAGDKFFGGNIATDSDVTISGGGSLIYNQGTFSIGINSATLTANRGIDFPDASGVVALTSNLTGYLTIANPTFTGTLIGPAATITTVTGALSGNATTATTLQTARTIALSGAATGTATSFNGSANITIPVTALNASNLNAGTVPDARLTGTYSGITLQTDGGNTHYTTPNTGSSSTNDRTVFGLAQYKSDSSVATGAIVFYAPNTNQTIMHRLRIEGMIYANAPTVACIVQGYKVSTGWSNMSKVNLGISDIQVRFAQDATGKNCVILGDVATTWSYPMMAITHAMFSHSGVTDAYCKDWTVGLVTSLTGFTQITGTVNSTAITTSVTGSSGTATTLQNARLINGVSFNGSANITVEPYVEDAVTTSVARYITFVDNSTAGYKRLNEDADLTYNPGTNTLTVPTVAAALSGNATTATTLQTARSISLGTAVTSTATNFNGAANITIPITGVSEAYLTWGGRNLTASYAPIDAALMPDLGANRLAFTNPANVIIEYSIDAGVTWTDYGASDSTKTNLLNGNQAGIQVGGGGYAAGTNYTNYQVRVTINTSGQIYTTLNKFIMLVSTNGSSGSWCTIDARTQSNYIGAINTWVTFSNLTPIAGWSGYNVINTSGLTTFGNTPSSQYGQVRFTFGQTGFNTTYTGLTIYKILGFGGVGWQTPSTLAATGQIYTYDYLKNVAFPATVSAVTFSGALSGNATTATTLQTARTLTIGSTGKTFDGSANVGWTLAEIGAAPETGGSYLPLAGGVMSGNVKRAASNVGFLEGSYNNVGANGSNTNPIYTIGSSYNPASTTLSNMYGIGYCNASASFITNTGATSWGMYVAANGVARVWLDGSNGNVSANGAMYSPIFYDSNDTGYYVDPASQSHVSTIDFSGSVTGSGAGAVIGRNHAYDTLELRGFGSEMMIGSQSSSLYINYRTCNSGAASNTPTDWYWMAGSTSIYSNHYMGLIQATESSRAPIFYDSGNTAYYVDPNGTSVLSTLTVNNNLSVGATAGNSYIYMGDSDEGTRIIHCNSNRVGFLNQASSWGSYCSDNGDWTTDFISYANASMRAPIFYDTNNTGYYLNPASTSNLSGLTVANTISGNISGNAGSATNATNSDNAGHLRTAYTSGQQLNPQVYFNNTIGLKAAMTGAWSVWSDTLWINGYSGGDVLQMCALHTLRNGTPRMAISVQASTATSYGTFYEVLSNYGGTGTYSTTGDFRAPIFYDSNNTGYYLNPASTSNMNVITAAGTMTASNFILSSDERKKTKIKDLSRDNINVSWKSFEMKNDEGEYRVGVIAQELEIEHPEFVRTDKDGFKSVAYIDLLIAKIAELEARLEKAGI